MNPIIAWFVRNGVAANLLMIFIIFAGISSAFTLPSKVFPEFGLDLVEVSVEYQGATPKEIEESIIQRVEEQVEGIEGIQEITATATENRGTVRIELARGENIQQRLDEVKSEIDRITTFPDEAEEPEVRELTNLARVVQIIVYGDAPERSLKELAYDIKDGLTEQPSISLVEVSGVRDYEISIEVSNDTLRARGLTLLDVAAAVRQGSLDLPGGDIQTRSEEVLLRTKGRNYNQQDFEDIVVIGEADGTQVLLKDIAVIKDGFRDTDLENRFNGQPAAFVEVYRVGEEKTLEIIQDVEKFLEEEVTPTLPPGLGVYLWDNDAEALNDRLSLLLKNGGIGLGLVIIALALFLDIRLAFWTTIGITIAFVGTLGLMSVLGLSINMMTLFGFILAIGIVVDDAIVAGENIFAENERGTPPMEAAILGAQRVSTPIIFAVATTIATFTPLLFIPSTIGKFLASVPAIVITVLFLSLVESLLILPRHLSHLGPQKTTWRNPAMLMLLQAQRGVSWGLSRFTDGPMRRALHFATDHWGVVISTGIAMIMLTYGFLAGGYLYFNFFPEVEGDIVTSAVELPQGSPVSETRKIAQLLQDKAVEAGKAMEADFDNLPDSVIQNMYVIVGGSPQSASPFGNQGGDGQSNQAYVLIEILGSEVRPFEAIEFEKYWRKAVGVVPGTKKLTFSSSLVSVGDPVQVEITAEDEVSLARATEFVQTELSRVDGIFDLFNDLEGSKREIELELKPEARTYGITVEQLAQQVRAAFFGSEALRVQRGREEVRVYVRLPEEERDTLTDLDDYRIRTPGGDFIPLSAVADVSFTYGPSTINRRNGKRVVSVTGSIDNTRITGTVAANVVSNQIVPRLNEQVSGITIGFGGSQREQARALPGLISNFMLALFSIYALLAMAFRSYVQPLIIMAAIPFGFIGAILGHALLDVNLTMLSIFGIVGLSGVIVNDALVMIDFVNEELEKGKPMREAIIDGALGRFRPILLTSITTFLGVFPLILERSVQAQFLVPTAISIAFGILFGTLVLMLLVPALAMAQHDLGKSIFFWRNRDDETRVPAE